MIYQILRFPSTFTDVIVSYVQQFHYFQKPGYSVSSLFLPLALIGYIFCCCLR